MKDSYTSIGLMSGTSLDGLDICAATFSFKDSKWSFKIDVAQGYSYPSELKENLGRNVQNMSAKEFVTLHSAYGKFLGERVNEFTTEFCVKADIIASHGHTVFHEPAKRIMYQIGDGAAIAAETGIPTVSDFRRLDIMLGGQGAPLVPIGDELLFGEYDYCLNIGGFSNISFHQGNKRIAFDISPVNYVINKYCRAIGLEMDKDGQIAASGTVCHKLLDKLNGLDYYSKNYPKSLGREWVEQCIFPILDEVALPLEDKLRTYYEHCAMQLAKITCGKNGSSINCGSDSSGNIANKKQMLVTGGGAYNKFLISRMKELSGCSLIIPEPAIVEFKEALIFAFLGVLYMCNMPSCLSSVTGARKDNIGGMLFKI